MVTSIASENGGLVIEMRDLPYCMTVAPLLLISTFPMPLTRDASLISVIIDEISLRECTDFLNFCELEVVRDAFFG